MRLSNRLVVLGLLLFTLMAGAFNETAAQPSPAPGVPRELARWRAEHYSDVRYALDIMLRPGAEMLEGRLKVTVTLDASAGDLVLDWRTIDRNADAASRVSDINANGRRVEDARFAEEHLVIPRSYMKEGVNVVELRFRSPVSTAGSAVTRYLDREDNSEYVYTLFVPSDASTAFPCFDQPDLKARFTLKMTAPEKWKVISNTEGATLAEFDETPGGLPQSPPAGMLWHHFPETEPISTYQFAFAAGPFEVLDAQRKVLMHRYPLDPKTGRMSHVHGPDVLTPVNDTPRIRLFVRKSKKERAEKELDEVARINHEGVKFFEDYFGHKFPFPKYDLVLIPEFAYGGMEHAGATFLREDGVLFPSDPTAADIAARAETMLHEAAHQWFGDLVTMRWFDDLWLKEGFATFMAYKAIEKLMPEFEAWKVFHLRTKPLAYLTDVTKGTTPIWQEIPNLSAAKSAYGNIVYRKAPSMLRQAEFYLGPREFQQAVQLFVKEHAYSNATWEDLVGAFERTSGRKLDAWAAAWVKRRGMPDVRVRWTANRRGRIDSFTVEQRDVLGEGGSWPMRVKIFLAYHPVGGPERTTIKPLTALTVTLDGGGAPQRVPEAVGLERPDYVFANYEDYGYGRFLLDDRSRAYVLAHFGESDNFLRALLWGSLWESVREAELPPSDFIALAVRRAQYERDDVMLAFVLSRAQTAFTRYLSDAQQKAAAPTLERALYEGMLHASTPGQRITYFRTYREVATSPEALDNLAAILAGKLEVPGMTLRSRDRFDIIRALVAAGDPRAAALLKAQGEADKTDDARRYAYAAGAAAPDAEVKRRYFAQYLGEGGVAESWVEASLGAFNTPRQSRLTLPYLKPALSELPALKRTHKIFFVNGWLAAFLGGQCDARAAEEVRAFLTSNPSLDRDLRLKVLEAADGLERCVRVRSKFAGEDADAARRAP
ncbi:MAG TPA: M1 family aminopeptidase [Pyrinomonadaceae bacterium]|nr:M1 family aminopeptidase [Pyrinomonadaceae bacterium]